MKLSMKQWMKLAITGALLTTSTHSFAEDKVTFQLDWLPGGDKAPIYVGIQQGYFKDADIDVTISSGRGSNDALTKIATGNADIGAADIVALLAAKANSDVPIKAVYSVFSKAPYAFYVQEGSGINSVKDIAGKTVVTSPFTSENIFLPLLFKKNGVEEKSVKVLKADPGALNPMLITGKADVMISWVTDQADNESQAESVGKKLKVLPWYDAGLEFYSSSLVASDKFLENRPDVAKRFVAAYAKAITYTWQHPEQSAQDIHKMVPEVEVKDAENTIEAIKGLVYNEVSDKNGIGTFEAARLKTTWVATAEALKIDPNSFDPESAVSHDFMPGDK